MRPDSRWPRRWPWWAVAILITGLLLRGALLISAEDRSLLVIDEQHYHLLARNILAGHGYCHEPGKPTSTRPPLYPLFLSTVWWVSGRESLQAVRAVQILLSLLNVFLLFRLGSRLYGRRIGMLAAALFWLYPSFIAYDLLLLSEVLFTLLLTLAALAYVSLGDNERWWAALATGAVFGFAALTRSALSPFPLLLCPLAYMTSGGPRSRRLRRAALLFAGYALVVAPWAARNTRVHGAFTLVDTVGGWNLLMGNYAHTPFERPWDAIKRQGKESWAYLLYAENPDASSWTEGQKQHWATRRAISFMLENPGLTAKRSLAKFADFWGLDREIIGSFQRDRSGALGWFVWVSTVAILASYVTTALLAALGLFLAPPARREAHLLLLLIVFQICAVHALTFGHSRYHLPLIPILLLWTAAAVLRQSWRQLRPSRARAGAALATQAALLLIWVREVFGRDADRIREFLDPLP